MKVRIAFYIFLGLELLCPAIMFHHIDLAHPALALVLWLINWVLFVTLAEKLKTAEVLSEKHGWTDLNFAALLLGGTLAAVLLAAVCFVGWADSAFPPGPSPGPPLRSAGPWFRWWEICPQAITWALGLGLYLAAWKPAKEAREYRSFADQFDESC